MLTIHISVRLRHPLDRHAPTGPHQLGSHPRQRLPTQLWFHRAGARPMAAVCRDRGGLHLPRRAREEDHDRARGGVSPQAVDGCVYRVER
jgi:hypothetical protein